MENSTKEKYKLLGSQIKTFLPGTSILVSYMLLLWALNRYFGVYGLENYIYTYIIFFGSIMLFSMIKHKSVSWKKVYEITKSLFFGIIFVMIIIKFYQAAGNYGILGVILAIVCYGLFMLFGTKSRRKRYFETLDSVEKLIFGKELKKFKKRPRIIFQWKRKEKKN